MSAKDEELTTITIFRTPHFDSHQADVSSSAQISKEQYCTGHQQSTEK